MSGKRRGPWSLAKYEERVAAATGLVRDKVGDRMWEKLYVEWAQTTRGGRRSEEDAIAQWKQWEDLARRKDPSVMSDSRGPGGKLRIWVHTADTATFRSQYMHEKEVTVEGKGAKAPKEEDLLKMRSDLLTNHDSVVGGFGAAGDVDAVARSMIADAPDTFRGIDGHLLSVFDLCPDGQEDEEDYREDDAQPQGGVDGENTESPTPSNNLK